MNNNTMELNMNEMEQVNGGIVWLIPYIVAAGGAAYALYKTYKVLSK